MAECNKFKKKWRVDRSDTDVFVVGSQYRIRKASGQDKYEFEFITDPPSGEFSLLTCETGSEGDVLVGTYTDTEGHGYPVVMSLAADDKEINGYIGDSVVEGSRKPGEEEEPVGTWNAEEEPPDAKPKEKKKDKDG